MANDPTEVIDIVYDGVEKAGTCTRRQFEKLWKPKGWKEAGERSTKPVATPGRTTPPQTPAAEEGS